MALEYSLEIATSASPSQVSATLLGLGFGFEAREGVFISPGVLMSVRPQTNSWREIIREAYQFEPSVSVYFRLDKFDLWEQGYQTTIRSSVALLRKLGCDGVLLFNWEIPEILQKQGHMFLNSQFGIWDSEWRLSNVSPPYEMRAILPPLP